MRAVQTRSAPSTLGRHAGPCFRRHGRFCKKIRSASFVQRGAGISAGDNFVFQIGAPDFFYEIRAMSCSPGRQRTFLFCREAMVPVYCMSGSVFMQVQVQVRIPKFFSCASYVSQRMILCPHCVSQRIFLCIHCVSQGLSFPQLYTRHQKLGVPKFSPPRLYPPENPPLYQVRYEYQAPSSKGRESQIFFSQSAHRGA